MAYRHEWYKKIMQNPHYRSPNCIIEKPYQTNSSQGLVGGLEVNAKVEIFGCCRMGVMEPRGGEAMGFVINIDICCL